MASTITVRTQPLTRSQLAEVLGNPRLVKLLENLAFDMTVTLPEAVDAVQVDSETTNTLVTLAQGIALSALALGTQAAEGPPSLPTVFPTIPEDARVQALESRFAALERTVADLQGDPSP